MKKVLLLGDSTRQGYDRYVKMAFDGSAEILYPSENCRFSAYILRGIYDWKQSLGLDEELDLVHWNAGLWDDLIMIDGKHHTPLALYRENIGRIYDTIGLLFPRAKQIFATSTPVQEELFFGPCKRKNLDTERYNEAAVETVLQRGGEINDLYTLVSGCPRDYYSDLAHLYTEAGTRLLSNRVIAVLENALGIKASIPDYHALFAKQDSVVGI